MSFDSPTRARLARFVTDARTLLADEFTEQFQSLYGLSPSGEVTPIENLTHLDENQRATAHLLRERLAHLLAASPADRNAAAAAVARLSREQAFTILNRLAAIRLAEKRGLIIESVGRAYQSDGFRVYCHVAGSGLGEAYDRYCRYLFCLFDELAVDLGVLFDRRSPFGLLFPEEPCLLKLLDLLNDPDLESLWAEDETIGWIYQYYNDPAERKKMREQSAAPRNSRELAVRNQFFTPRYVVQFLTDNTLGRIWYEMTKGHTKLRSQCRYLLRRPHEYFLHDSTQNFQNLRPGLFSKGIAGLPDDPNWEEIQAVAFTLYGAADQLLRDLGLGEVPDFGMRKRREFESTGKYEGTFAELFCCLYFEQRDAKWSGQGDPDPEGRVRRARILYQAMLSSLRQDTTNPQPSTLNSQPAATPTQEKLLRQPVFIPHRPPKDPRTILMLDPACGSMHFGLYAFDLFETIYEEAWDLEEVGTAVLSRPEGMKSLRESYPDKQAFLRDVPRLIIEHNIHGIEIDPRCVQIAGLSLWLRAQRTWKDQNIPPADRPQIRRSNIVCAEPMPGERDLLKSFVEEEFPARERPIFLRLLEAIFDKMQLAGEAGSLLKIEEEIRHSIEEARAAWQKLQDKPRELFSTAELNAATRQPELDTTADLRPLTADFWETAESRLVAALRDYAEQAESAGGLQRRLFAEDAARGFAFIDVCRKRYDVALMNPPFGEAGLPSRDYLYAKYTHATQDIFSAFVDRGLEVLEPDGGVGAITSRLAFYLELLEEWRVRLFGATGKLSVMADLGYGVLDAALVEAAAYVVRKSNADSRASDFISLLAQEDKGAKLLQACSSVSSGTKNNLCFAVDPRSFIPVPASRAAYWVSDFWRQTFRSKRVLKGVYGFPFVGFQTGDDEFFLRLAWEAAPDHIGGRDSRWVTFAKGGEYAQFFADHHLLVNWACRRLARRQSNPEGYFRPGITYTERTTSNLSARILPADCVFSPNGVTIVAEKPRILECAALLNTRASQLLIELCVGGGDAVYSGSAARHYGPRIIGSIPAPKLADDQAETVSSASLVIWRCFRNKDASQEPGRYFVSPFFGGLHKSSSLVALAEQRQSLWEDQVTEIIKQHHLIDRVFARAFRIEGALNDELIRETGAHPNDLPLGAPPSPDSFKAAFLTPVEDLIDQIVQEVGASRSLTKKTYVADRQLELLSLRFGLHPAVIIRCRREGHLQSDAQIRASTEDIASFVLGCAFGRWDIRYTTAEKSVPELSDPFAPLPACPPGQLQNSNGLPAGPDDVPADYPVRNIPWDGILVDDEGHNLDILTRVRKAVELIWKDCAEAIENEACEILGVKSLREYFLNPADFFADHLKRYSKSRRQAPIYWPLSTASGRYTIWIYYHRLNDQTLHKVLADFVDPKIKEVDRRIAALREQGKGGTEVGELQELWDELREFRVEIERVIKLPWKPDLDDGVLITACPLWKLFRLPKWRKDLEACWKDLEHGDYDWAHLAYSIWPDRVREKCKTDHSLAIAHNLEAICEVKAPEMKAKKGKKKKQQMDLEEAE